MPKSPKCGLCNKPTRHHSKQEDRGKAVLVEIKIRKHGRKKVGKNVVLHTEE